MECGFLCFRGPDKEMIHIAELFAFVHGFQVWVIIFGFGHNLWLLVLGLW